MAEKPVVKDGEVAAALADIEEARGHLGEALSRLRHGEGLNPLDVRRWVRNHPVESALGAAAAGFILAQPARGDSDGTSHSLLSGLTRSGLDSMLPFLLKTIL